MARHASKLLAAVFVVCTGCSSVKPIVLVDLDSGAYLTDKTNIERLIGGDRPCVMARAARCAYQVEQYVTAPSGKMDRDFCQDLLTASPADAYGSPIPRAPRIQSAWVPSGPRGPLVRVQVPDKANRSRDAAFVARRGDEIIIAFRGTLLAGKSHEAAFVADWLNDADFELVADAELDGVEVHKGFRDSLANVLPDVTVELNKLLEGSLKVSGIYLTGHSKGGAMAYIAALKLKRRNPSLPIKGVYTFAAPRPGGEAFRKEYQALLGSIGTWRYEHRADFIPLVVPEESEVASLRRYLNLVGLGKLPIGQYRSVGNLVFINGDSGIVVQLDSRERKLDELRAKALDLSGAWSAHKMNTYLETACRRTLSAQ
jgi:hypothetical protein